MGFKYHAKADEVKLIGKIFMRAVAIWQGWKRTDIHMDIEHVHANGCPLDLQKFLEFPKDDFLHDLIGIDCNVGMDGTLKNCFVPRCATGVHPQILTLHQKVELDKLIAYPIQIEGKNFEVGINPQQSYGFFEHNRYGDERGGGLWFEKKELVDHDGTYSLPFEVCMLLNCLGFTVNADFVG